MAGPAPGGAGPFHFEMKVPHGNDLAALAPVWPAFIAWKR
jgi:hypothetical protein